MSATDAAAVHRHREASGDEYLRRPNNVHLHENIPFAMGAAAQEPQFKQQLKAAFTNRPVPFAAGQWGDNTSVRISDDGTEVTFKFKSAAAYPVLLLFSRELLREYSKVWASRELSLVQTKIDEALLWHHMDQTNKRE